MSDSTCVEDARSEIYTRVYNSSTIEELDLDKSICREYRVSQWTWTTSQARGYALGFLDFPGCLFTQPFIADKIKGFDQYRTGFKLRIMVTSSSNNYGSLFVVRDPLPNLNQYINPTMENLIANDHVLVSASNGKSVDFIVPYINTDVFAQTSDPLANSLASVYFYVLNPLFNVLGDNSTATVSVYASMIEPKFKLPTDPYSLSTSGWEVHSKNSVSFHPEVDEALIKSEENSISSTFESKKLSKYLMRTVKIASAFKSVVQVGSMLATGMNKPNSLSSVMITGQKPFQGLSYGKGLDHSTVMSIIPEDGIATELGLGGDSKDMMDLVNLAKHPTLVKSMVFTNATGDSIICPLNPYTSSTGIAISHFDWLANLFMYYSGSIKHKLYIFSSPMIQSRFAIYITNLNAADNYLNCYHKIVEVNGDSEISFVTPFLCPRVVDTVPTSYPMWLRIVRISSSSPNNAIDPPIYFNYYRSAHDDIQFSGYKSAVFVHCRPIADFESDFDPFVEGMKSYEHGGLVAGAIDSLRTMSHSSSPIANKTASFTVASYEPRNIITSTPQYSYGYEIFGRIFRFWRGGTRVKVMSKNSSRLSAFCSVGPSYVQAIAHVTSNNEFLEIDVPYYSSALFNSTDKYSEESILINFPSSTVGGVYYFKCSSDDFSFMHPRTPPSFPQTSSLPGNFGMANFITWTTT